MIEFASSGELRGVSVAGGTVLIGEVKSLNS